MSASSRPAEYGIIPREIAMGMSGLELLQSVLNGALPGPPIAQAADFWVAELENGRVVFEGMPSMKFYNPLGTVHGGWISAILDSAMGCAVHSTLGAGQTFTTTSMTINSCARFSRRRARCAAKVSWCMAAHGWPPRKHGCGTPPASCSRMAPRPASS